jgi:hypothetical protein
VATVLVVCFGVVGAFFAVRVVCGRCGVDARVVRVGELRVVEVVDPLRVPDLELVELVFVTPLDVVPVLVVREVDVGFAVDFVGVVVVGAGSGAGSGFGVGPAARASPPENAMTSTASAATTRRAIGALGVANPISPPENGASPPSC